MCFTESEFIGNVIMQVGNYVVKSVSLIMSLMSLIEEEKFHGMSVATGTKLQHWKIGFYYS